MTRKTCRGPLVDVSFEREVWAERMACRSVGVRRR